MFYRAITDFTCTINVERFAGLNIHGFSPMKFSQKHFHRALGRSGYYLVKLKRGVYFIMSYKHFSSCIHCFHKINGLYAASVMKGREAI